MADVTRTSLAAAASVLPVTDASRSIGHYRALGSEVVELTDEYAIAQRDGVALHLSLVPDMDPSKGA